MMRKVIERGLWEITCSPKLNFQSAVRCSSLALAMAARHLAEDSSSRCRQASRVVKVKSVLRAFAVRHIHPVVFQDVVAKHRQRRTMHRQLAHLHRLLVRHPVRLVLRHTFERAAGVRYLDVVVLQEEFQQWS